jgi:hypothetical protein
MKGSVNPAARRASPYAIAMHACRLVIPSSLPIPVGFRPYLSTSATAFSLYFGPVDGSNKSTVKGIHAKHQVRAGDAVSRAEAREAAERGRRLRHNRGRALSQCGEPAWGAKLALGGGTGS